MSKMMSLGTFEHGAANQAASLTILSSRYHQSSTEKHGKKITDRYRDLASSSDYPKITLASDQFSTYA